MDERGWTDLARAQEGLISTSQLRGLEVTPGFVRHQVKAGRWQQCTRSVFCTTTGPLSFEQRLWRAVLHPGEPALIGGLTACAIHGLKRWERDSITVLVSNPDSFDPLQGVSFVRSRRLGPDWVSPKHQLPVARPAPAVLLFAAYEPHLRTALGAVTATVQQRLTDVEDLADWLARMRPLRRARHFRALLGDLSGGAQSLAEVDLRKACRAFGVALPRSQRPRLDRSGRRRFTDAEWRLPDGRTLVLEVDGAFHDDVIEAGEHRARNRKLTTLDRIVIQCSALELRDDPWSVMQDLLALGVPRAS